MSGTHDRPWLACWAGFVTIVGLSASVVGLLTAPDPWRWVGLCGIGVAAMGAAALSAWRAWRRSGRAARAIPTPLQVDECRDGYYLVRQTTTSDMEGIALQERSVYAPNDAIPVETLREWHTKNPTGFSVIERTDRTLAGHLNLLAIRPATLEKFLQGSICERDIHADCLYGPTEREHIRNIHVESLLVRPPSGSAPVAALRALRRCIWQRFDSIADMGRVDRIYGIDGSPQGAQLLRHLGFSPDARWGGARRDGHTLFSIESAALMRSLKGSPRV